MNKLEALKNNIEFYKILRENLKDEDFYLLDFNEIIGDLIAQYNELIYAENILKLCLTGE